MDRWIDSLIDRSFNEHMPNTYVERTKATLQKYENSLSAVV